MPLAQRVCQSILSGGLGELGPQKGGSGGMPPGCCGAAQQQTKSVYTPSAPTVGIVIGFKPVARMCFLCH
jgi:hypothetical protein